MEKKKTKTKQSQAHWHMFRISEFIKQRQKNHSQFEGSLVYLVSSGQLCYTKRRQKNDRQTDRRKVKRGGGGGSYWLMW